jgi:cysteinyl-tRNA synthetase
MNNHKDILDTIGSTPLVPIRNLNKNATIKIFAKLEYFNPGGSIKDRVALSMIEDAEKSGQLTTDKIIIEATSGNTGIGLALVAAVKGYKLTLAMSESASEERKRILKALGAHLIYTLPRLGTDGAIEEVYKMARENPDKYWLADQYSNESNWKAHYYGTAVEIWQQTKGEVTMVVAAMGTTGTAMGTSRRLKEYNSNIKIVGVEPYLGHKIQGMKNMRESYRPEIFNAKLLDHTIHIEDEEAFHMVRRLAKEEGMFVGMSSGAAMAGALRAAKDLDDGIIVVILPDGGERYLSTNLFMDRKKTNITLYNTLSRKKDEFIPMKEDKISIYSCGPAVSRLPTISECRKYIAVDLLRRYLEYRGFTVEHVLNITDLDDTAIQGSEGSNEDLKSLTLKNYKEFLKDMDSLSIKRAAKYPFASGHVDDMIDVAEKLMDKGFAYERLRSVYFDISRYTEYGRLSRVDLSKIRVGKTVNLDRYEKDNPRDFALLKRSTLNELKRGIFFNTKWGNVRPSWHIECAAISMKYLGEISDINFGGVDTVFPHNENVIAISSAINGKPLANYWLHSEMVKEKKSSQTPTSKKITLRDLLDKGFSGGDIRYWLISMHYRKVIDLSFSKISIAGNTVSRLNKFIHKLHTCRKGPAVPEIDQIIYDLSHKFNTEMDNDLNIAPALAALFEFVHKIHAIIDSNGLDESDKKKVKKILSDINSVLMIMDFSEEKPTEQIEALMKERDVARENKDWFRADALRENLDKLGVEVIDTKKGTTWRRKI